MDVGQAETASVAVASPRGRSDFPAAGSDSGGHGLLLLARHGKPLPHALQPAAGRESCALPDLAVTQTCARLSPPGFLENVCRPDATDVCTPPFARRHGDEGGLDVVLLPWACVNVPFADGNRHSALRFFMAGHRQGPGFFSSLPSKIAWGRGHWKIIFPPLNRRHDRPHTFLCN